MWDFWSVKICRTAAFFLFSQRLIASDRNVGLRKTRDKTCSFLRPMTMANGSNLGQSPAVLQ